MFFAFSHEPFQRNLNLVSQLSLAASLLSLCDVPCPPPLLRQAALHISLSLSLTPSHWPAADTLGVNLNRYYGNSRPESQPSIFGASCVVEQLHARGELRFYVDTHGHASKRGCFFYGNSLPLEQQAWSSEDGVVMMVRG